MCGRLYGYARPAAAAHRRVGDSTRARSRGPLEGPSRSAGWTGRCGTGPGDAPCRCQFQTGLRTPRPSLNHLSRARLIGYVSHNIGDRRPRLPDLGVRYQRGWAALGSLTDIRFLEKVMGRAGAGGSGGDCHACMSVWSIGSGALSANAPYCCSLVGDGMKGAVRRGAEGGGWEPLNTRPAII